MTDTLQERLRAVTAFYRFETGNRVAASACLSEEAADALDAMDAENARLREALREIAELPGRRWQRKAATTALRDS